MSGCVAGKPLSSGAGRLSEPCFHSAGEPSLVPLIWRPIMRRSSSWAGCKVGSAGAEGFGSALGAGV